MGLCLSADCCRQNMILTVDRLARLFHEHDTTDLELIVSRHSSLQIRPARLYRPETGCRRA